MTQLTGRARELRNKYQNEYRRTHKEAIKKYMVTYWEKKAGIAPGVPEVDTESTESILTNEVNALRCQGLSQRKIAEQLCISVGYVNKLLNK